MFQLYTVYVRLSLWRVAWCPADELQAPKAERPLSVNAFTSLYSNGAAARAAHPLSARQPRPLYEQGLRVPQTTPKPTFDELSRQLGSLAKEGLNSWMTRHIWYGPRASRDGRHTARTPGLGLRARRTPR